MAMFPIFMIGLVAGLLLGITLTNLYFYKKRNVPSEVKFKLQEAEIIKYRSDIELLESANEKLHKKIEKLENKK